MPPRRPLSERFLEKVDKSGPIMPNMDTPCWTWTASKDEKGYGWIGDGNGHMCRANRISYTLNVGPIPVTNPRTLALHHCDNPSCVNPDHLFLGTDADNNADKTAKGRNNTPRGVDAARAKLTPEQVIEIRSRRANGESMSSLAREYGVWLRAIQCIVYRYSWAWL
jgi:hypothetical protein